MSALNDHARSMLAYNQWANERILLAAKGLPPHAQPNVAGILAHMIGTQLYWHANWTHSAFEEPSADLSLAELTAVCTRSTAQLAAIGETLTDEEWQRREAWWKQWGVDAEATLGMTLFQVIYHGIQHRAEIAMVLTEHGFSPGDLDYLVFLRDTAPRS
jgi:uncharacterized damage-inducible protein DinB